MTKISQSQLLRCNLLCFTLALCCFRAESRNWSNYANRLTEQNFTRSKNKIQEFLQEKYNISPIYFSLNNQIQKLRSSHGRYSKACLQSNEQNCFHKVGHILPVLRQASILTSKLLSKELKSKSYKLIGGKTLLTEVFALLQKKPNSLSELNKSLNHIDSLLLQYLTLWVKNKPNAHIFLSLDLLNTESSQIITFNQARLDEFSKNINYFIRKEKESTRKSSGLRHLELINLFWNNVLKIKKDQR